jgi:hypothetical protein
MLTMSHDVATDDGTGPGGTGGDGGGDAGNGGSGGNGGAIANEGVGTVTLSSSTISDDSTDAGGEAGGLNGGATGGNGGNGGGIYSAGSLNLSSSTVSDNVTGGGASGPGSESVGDSGGDAGNGAGIFSAGALTLGNDTVAGNETGSGANGDTGGGFVGGNGGSGGSGGGIYSSGGATFANDTVAYNDVDQGGSGASGTDVSGTNGPNGTGGGIESVAGTTKLTATIVAASFAGGACSGTVTDGGYNIDDDGSCRFVSPSISDSPLLDSTLGALTPNGGPTETVPLLPGSPAIKKVLLSADCPNPDQRGAKRKGRCDIGAYSTKGNPKITSFSPTKAKAGRLVTINGSKLSGATSVSFNGTPAEIITNSSTTITVDVPAGAATGRISVTTYVGGTVTSTGAFKVK